MKSKILSLKALLIVLRIIIVSIVLIFNNNNILKSQNKDWKLVDSITYLIPNNQPSSYLGLRCADSLNCIIWAQLYGSGGHYFRRTTDGGKTWKNVYMDSAYINWENLNDKYLVPDLRDISYPNTRLFIAVGDSGLIVRTTDNGRTWSKFYFDKKIVLGRIRMIDDKKGLLNGCMDPCESFSDIKDYITSDGGLTWLPLIRPNNISLSNLDLINDSLFCGLTTFKNQNYETKYKLVWVHNNWESWDTVSSPPLLFLDFIDSSFGWGASYVKLGDTSAIQLIYHTSDGGKSWEKQRDTIYNGWGMKDIKFYDRYFGMASSGFCHVAITTNGGKKWNDYEIEAWHYGHGDIVNNIQIPNATTAFVILDFQYIYKYTRDITSVPETKKETSISISPIPAWEYIEISGIDSPTVNRRVHAMDEIKIYNLLGECVMTEPIHPMTPSHRMNIENLPAGVYFVRIGDWVGRFVKSGW